MPTWLKVVLGIVGVVGVAVAVVAIIASTKDMTMIDYIKSWFETAEETLPEVEETVATMLIKK